MIIFPLEIYASDFCLSFFFTEIEDHQYYIYFCEKFLFVPNYCFVYFPNGVILIIKIYLLGIVHMFRKIRPKVLGILVFEGIAKVLSSSLIWLVSLN